MRQLLYITAALSALAAAGAALAENPKVSMQTNQGTITLELYQDKAPQTVENFLACVDSGFYEGTTFHRVIRGFMVQGGGYTEDMKKKPTRDPIQNEADNGLKNDRGTVAMARTGIPHSATAQFFINHKDNAFLNHTDKTPRGWGYTVFGKVAEGMEVVDAIAALPTGAKGPFRKDVPQTTVVIEKVARVKE